MEARSPGLLPLPEIVVQQAAAQQGALLFVSPQGEAYMTNLNKQPCILRVYNSCGYDHFIRESELAQVLHHPNLLQALALCSTPSLKAIAYRSPPCTPLPTWLATPNASWPHRLAAIHGAASALGATVAANRRLKHLADHRKKTDDPFPTHGMIPRLSPETLFITASPRSLAPDPQPDNPTPPPAHPSPAPGSAPAPPATLILTDWTFFLIGSPLVPDLVRPQELLALASLIHLLVLPPASPLLQSPASIASSVAQAVAQSGSAAGLVDPCWEDAPPGILKRLLGLAQGIPTSFTAMSPPVLVDEVVKVMQGLMEEAGL